MRGVPAAGPPKLAVDTRGVPPSAPPPAAPVAGLKAGERGSFALRPEQVRLVAHGEAHELHNHFHGQIRDHLYTGNVTVYKVALDNGVVVEALLANSSPGRAKFFEIGDAVGVGWRSDAGVYLRD